MLDSLRTKTTGWVAGLIIGIVTVPFLFFGINNYFSGNTSSYVAKVGKEEIGPDQFRNRLQEERSRAQSAMGEAFDPAMFDDPVRKRALLDRMVEEELLFQAARDAGAEMTDARLRQEIESLDSFQTDGKFDPIQYQLLLQSRQMSPQGFQELIRRDMTMREVPAQIAGTAAVSDREVDRYLALEGQTRDARYFVVPPVEIAAPDAQAVARYYREHPSEFMSEEQLAIEYVVLDGASMKVDTTPDDATLRTRYDEQKSTFTVPEQRLASHILIALPQGADAGAQKAAAAKAAALLAEVRGGKSFAEVAQASSDDTGSKEAGGDLGWLEKGMTDPAFEKALFALGAGTISEPVRSAEGLHLIDLREVKAGSSKSFDEVRDELAVELLESERERVYADKSGELIDQVYADPSALEPAAEALGLKIERSAFFSRAGGAGIAGNPKVVETAFSEAVLTEGNVSDPIDLGPNRLAMIKLAEHKPSVLRPIKEVYADAAARLQRQLVSANARKRATALEAEFKAGKSLAELARGSAAEVIDAANISRKALNHDREIVEGIFKLPRPGKDKPTESLLELPRDRHVLVELTRVTPGNPAKSDKAAREQAHTLLRAALATAETRAFIDSLRKRSEIVVAEDRM